MTTLPARPRSLGDTATRRPRRILVLLIGVVVLSTADLVLTVTHLTSFGMIEANPVAAWLIRTTDSPMALAMFKLVTVVACCVTLWAARRHVLGELGAWFSVAVLAVLSIQWHRYSTAMEDPSDVAVILGMPESDGEWMRLAGVE